MLTFTELIGKTDKDLETIFQQARSPQLKDLVGHEYNGFNCTKMASILGIRKFRKGFFDPDNRLSISGEIEGYNVPVFQNAAHLPWMAKPSEENPRHFGYYTVRPAREEPLDNRYRDALMLNYARSKRNGLFKVERILRDYLVAVRDEDPRLLLGKAYLAAGSGRIYSNFFVLASVDT